MAGLICKNRVLLSRAPLLSQLSARAYGGGDAHHSGLPLPQTKVDIGQREVVGFGGNGEATYIDSVMAPFPAIRFKEDAGEIMALREKEKGDWKKLTKEEKKVLYRASFCQTLAEVEAPTGEWKSVLGLTLVGISIGVWGYLWMKAFVYGKVPDTITNEDKQKAQIDRMIAMRVNPIEGLTSNYDYEKGQWKK
eukprot:GFUD01057885.1.p1 GENE.GFUD01057885.1~~GFUD01057885.1.p1  ORF type:complete len:193 (-),score=52.49 GFUD01057885.1:321-899(-)